MSYNVILWDLDGTIADTRSLMEYSIKEVVTSEENKPYLLKKFNPKISPYSFFKKYNIDTQTGMKKYWHVFTRYIDDYVKIYHNIHEVLSKCHSNDKKMAIVSSLPDQKISLILQANKIYHYFNTIVGYHDTKKNKPNPDPIIEALDRIDVKDKKESLYIGDSPNDQKAARNAGLDFYWASWGYFLESDLSQPLNVLISPEDILEYLS